MSEDEQADQVTVTLTRNEAAALYRALHYTRDTLAEEKNMVASARTAYGADDDTTVLDRWLADIAELRRIIDAVSYQLPAP